MSAQLKLQPTPKIECSPEEWEARVDLACLYRLVSHLGWHKSLIYNHISMRVPGPAPVHRNHGVQPAQGRFEGPQSKPVALSRTHRRLRRAQLGTSRARRRE